MSQIRRVAAIFRVPADDPELSLSQYHAIAGQLPLLYVILLVNTLAVAATHFRVAPVLMTVVLPLLFVLAGGGRALFWHRRRGMAVSAPEALKFLRHSTRIAPILGGCMVTWALVLYPYGDAFAKSHVAFYISITIIGCIFCLMPLRAAAFWLTLVVIPPSIVYFALSGEIVIVAISVNLAVVALCMVTILIRHYSDFLSLSDSRKLLIARQAETQRLSDENFHLANIDTLTNLPNRRGFFRDLDHALRAAPGQPDGRSVTVGLVDLDGFKPINDIFGHAIGDAVLHEVGRRISSLAFSQSSFARLGGDEFGFIVKAASEEESLEFARSVCAVLRAPYVMGTTTAELSASVGLAIYPDVGQTAEQLFERADYALYYAKQNRRGTPVIFSHDHQVAIREAARLEQTLRHADLDAELSLAFQPIFDLDVGRTVAFECLARWTSPEIGGVDPAAFIKSAERSDLINRLTELLLQKALAAALAWPENIRISFNLSIRDIASDDSVRRISDILTSSGVRPSRIDIEVTETAVMRDFDQARRALLALKALGVQISLDDFGTGYSSLSYVHRLPLDKIKVDRSFTADIDRDPVCLNIVKTVLDLCRNLKLLCVVEGLETAAQVRIVRGLGCSLMQGYFLGGPMPATEIPAFLKAEANLIDEAVLSRTAGASRLAVMRPDPTHPDGVEGVRSMVSV